MRLPIALTILCLCGISAFWGWRITHFAEAVTRAGNLRPWIGFPGLTSPALEALLQNPRQGTQDSLATREHMLTALIAAEPMSAQAWLSLAGNQLASGHPSKDVDASVMMSRLSGPNEGVVMWKRALLELLRWDALSEGERYRFTSEMAIAMRDGAVNDAGANLARAIFAEQSPKIRDELAELLATAGLSPMQIKSIGLQQEGK